MRTLRLRPIFARRGNRVRLRARCGQQAGQEETPSGSPGSPSDGDRERRDGNVFR